MESYDTVPEEFQEWHDDIDYGTVETDVEYYSNTAGDYKYCNVLLPAGYDESQEYPVLYMFHGFGGRYDSHVHEGSILQTLYGKMLHDGLAVPMIMVGADMYTGPLAEKDGMSDEEMRPYYDKGIDDLVQDLMPFIESRYSVKTGRQYTAVTGVSQGGTDALAAGFKWQAKIGYIGSFAPCTGVIPTPYYRGTFWNTPILDDFVIESPETMPIYIYQLVGSEDPWCIDSTLYYGKVMDQKGIPNQTDLVEGYDHDNDLWRLGHYNFMQKIFLDQ
jgi:enterochelin esterase-like enzyme